MDLRATNKNSADSSALAQQGNGKPRSGITPATTRRLLTLRELGFGFGIDVMDVDRMPVDDRTTGHRAAINGQRHCRERPVGGYHPKDVILDTKNLGTHRVTQPSRILRDHIKHGLEAGRRAGDHAQNVTSRSELFSRFVAFPS